MKPTLSVIIPALNEEANIAAAVAEVLRTVGDRFADYELLLFDDGSRDRTGAIMDELASTNPRLRVTHNPTPHNLGGVYQQGIQMARHEYAIMVPGDNENPGSAIEPVLDQIGKADIVIPYPLNQGVRPFARRVISRTYIGLMNLLFGCDLPYYNGTTICRVASVCAIRIRTASFAYQSEVLVKLLHQGASYVTVGIEIQPQPGRTSKALHWRNVVRVCQAIARLWFEVRFQSPNPRKSSGT